MYVAVARSCGVPAVRKPIGDDPIPSPRATSRREPGWRTFLSAPGLREPGEAMRDAVIVGAVRTPIGKRAGSLKDVRPDDLAAFALRALVDRTRIDPRIVEDVVMGCVTQIGEQGMNIG